MHQEVVKAVKKIFARICNEKSKSLSNQLRFRDFKADDVLKGGLFLQGVCFLLFFCTYKQEMKAQ